MAGPWEKYATAPAASNGPWSKYAAPEESKQPESWSDPINAVGTGFNRALVRLAGLPADTAANVLDLGKAAIGAPYMALTGKPAPSWLELGDRSKVVGSGDHLLSLARKTEAGRAVVDPQNKGYEGGYLQTAGGALTGVARPSSVGELTKQLLLAQASAGGGKAVADATGNPALAITAGLAPQGLANAVTTATKAVVRGGESGRQAMEQRIADLRNAGIENPTLGLASGNAFIGGAENLLQNTPGAVGTMRAARDNAVNGLQRTVEGAAATASPTRSALGAGQQVQAGIQSFKDDFKAQQGELYNRLDQFIPSRTPTGVPNTQSALSLLNADIPGAPSLSRFFKNGKIQSIEAALNSDLGQDRAYTPSQLRGAFDRGPQTGAEFNGLLGHGALPWEAVKKTRSLVGNEIADNSLLSDVPRSKWNPLYGALSTDMQAAAQQSGPAAAGAFNRATNYTRAGMDRLDTLRPFADKAAPEQAFTSLVNTTKENGSVFDAVKKSLPEGARGAVAGTVIDRLGKAPDGQQNAAGDRWSPDTFLTNWNRMTPASQKSLLSGFPNADKVRADIEAAARAASMMRDNSKMWANPSGTAANIGARGLLSSVPLGAAGAVTGLLSPLVPVGAAGLLGANRYTAGKLTSKDVVDAMARRTVVSPEDLDALTRTMVGGGLLSPK